MQEEYSLMKEGSNLIDGKWENLEEEKFKLMKQNHPARKKESPNYQKFPCPQIYILVFEWNVSYFVVICFAKRHLKNFTLDT
jgi:hypothetical protein